MVKNFKEKIIAYIIPRAFYAYISLFDHQYELKGRPFHPYVVDEENSIHKGKVAFNITQQEGTLARMWASTALPHSVVQPLTHVAFENIQ